MALQSVAGTESSQNGSNTEKSMAQMVEELMRYSEFLNKCGRYREALNVVDEAVFRETRKEKTSQLFAAKYNLHVKLGEHLDALTDARLIIKECPEDVSGYLRACNMLLELGLPNKAVALVEHALRKVPKNDGKRPLLEKLVNRGHSRLDPFKKLPIEVAFLILEKLDFVTIIVSLRVNRRWNSLIHGCPKAWKSIDFSKVKRRMKAGNVQRCLQQSQNTCQRLTIRNVSDESRVLLNAAVTMCPRLTFLETEIPLKRFEVVRANESLKELSLSSLHSSSSAADIQRVVRKCPNLEKLVVLSARSERDLDRFGWRASMLNLKYLHLQGDRGVSGSDGKVTGIFLPGLLLMTPALETLRLDNWDMTGELEEPIKLLDLTHLASLKTAFFEDASLRLPKLPESLKSLSMRTCSLTPPTSPEYYDFPSLKCLDLSYNTGMPIDWPGKLINASNGGLKVLGLPDLGGVVADQFGKSTAMVLCQNLTHVCIPNNAINDGVIDQLIETTTKLQVVDLSHTEVTSVAIKNIVQTQPSLKTMILIHCENVKVDVVEWARERGVTMNYSFPNGRTSCTYEAHIISEMK